MFENVAPEKAIAFVKMCVIPSCCWPLSKTASTFQVVCLKFVRFLAILNGALVSLPLLYAVYLFRDNSIMCAQVICLVPAVMQIPLQTILCIANYDRLRSLIEEMINYCKMAESFERSVFQRYVNKYCKFYGVCCIWYYLTPTTVVFGTLLLPQQFPTPAEYPFPVDYEPLRTTIFIHQSVAGFQIASHISVRILGVLLMLFASARFEILSMELNNVTSVDEMVNCLKKYYAVRRYAEEAISIIQFMDLITLTVCTVTVVNSGLQLIARGPFLPKVQFVFVGGTALLDVFMHAWPADNLLNVSENVLRGVYESPWYDQSLRVQKTVLRMLIPQTPVAICVKCFIPRMSLNYYCTYVSNAFSFLTFFRTMMVDEDET